MKYIKLSLFIIVSLALVLGQLTFAQAITEDDPLDLNGTFAVSIDVETGEIIYAKGIDEKTYPASTTKIMTALIFAENFSKTDVLTYTESALDQPSYALNKDYGPISLGYEMTAENIMKSLLVYSANDVAVMVEDHLQNKNINLTETFNNRIESLGLKNSHYRSPNGIHNENHYTTAYDLSMMAIEAFSNPWVQETLKEEEVIIQVEKGILPVKNPNSKLKSPATIYAKTGYTEEAGRCLVALYEQDGRQIVGAVLNATFNFEDMIVFEDMDKLMDWSFKEASRISYLDQIDFDYEVEVTYKPLKTFGSAVTKKVPLIYQGDLSYYPNLTNDKEIKYKIEMYDVDIDSLNKTNPVGKIILQERNINKELLLYPTLDGKDLYNSHANLYRNIKIGIGVGVVLLILLISFIAIKVKRNMRRRKRIF